MPVQYQLISQKPPPNSGKEGTIVYARSVLRGTVGTKELAQQIAKMSTVSLPDVIAVCYALGEVIPDALLDGKKVVIDGVGEYRLSARTGALPNPDKAAASDFKPPSLLFRPSPELKKAFRKVQYEQK